MIIIVHFLGSFRFVQLAYLIRQENTIILRLDPRASYFCSGTDARFDGCLTKLVIDT